MCVHGSHDNQRSIVFSYILLRVLYHNLKIFTVSNEVKHYHIDNEH